MKEYNVSYKMKLGDYIKNYNKVEIIHGNGWLGKGDFILNF
jgi:hypothetical protein